MFRLSGCILLLLCVYLAFCTRHKFPSEKEEVAYWNAYVLDSAYSSMYRHKDTTAALQLFDAALQKTSIRSEYTMAARHLLLANYFYFFSDDNKTTGNRVDSALAAFNTPALQHWYPRSYVNGLLFGGLVAYRLRFYNKANEYYFRAKKLAETYLDPCEQRSFNYNIAMVLFQQQNYRESLAYFNKAFLLQNTCTPQTDAMALQQQEIQSNIGLCLLHLKSYDSALAHFDRALQIANQYKEALGPVAMDKISGVIDGHKGMVYQAMGQTTRAEQLCRRSIALNARPGYEEQHAQGIKLLLAEINEQQRDPAGMYQILSDLREDLDRLPNKRVELGWRRLMSAYFAQKDNPRQSLAFYKSHITLRDSMESEQKALSAADVNHQMEVREREGQIALLKKDKQIAEFTLGITLGTTLLVSIILLLLYNNYRRNKKSLAISLKLHKAIEQERAAREEDARQRHKDITEAVIKAQERERAIIGLELHDNVNQVLTTVKLYTGMALEGTGDQKVLLTKASGFLQQCIDEIRLLSRRLSAPSLGKISLVESLNDLLDSIAGAGRINITRNFGQLTGRSLSKDLHIGLYRIVQEGLNNILKHAHATEGLISLEERNNMLHLLITDNGKGFDSHKPHAGLGLMNMKSRAESLEGTFLLESAQGEGCCIRVSIPLH